jgi:hypothetical protein
MRGAVPHYIAGSPNPKVAHALLAKLSDLYGLGLDLSDMARAARRFERQVDESLADRHDMAEYVKTLEARAGDPEPDDAPDTPPESESEGLPSGEDIVRQFEEFLRERSSGDEPSSGSQPS